MASLRIVSPGFPLRVRVTLESIDELIGAECLRAEDAGVQSPALEVLARHRSQIRVDNATEAAAIVVAVACSTYPETHPRTAQRILAAIGPGAATAGPRAFLAAGEQEFTARNMMAAAIHGPPEDDRPTLRIFG